MAKSKLQIIDSLLQEVTKFKMTDDNALITSRQWLSDKIDSYRATVLKKAILERKKIPSAYQVVNCLEPECLGIECEIEGIQIKADADIWKVEIPELMDFSKSIKYFGLSDLQNPYDEVDIFGMSVRKNRFGRKIRNFTRVGNYIYYENFDGTRIFTLIGIMAYPSNVCGFQINDPYPLGIEYEQQLELLVKKDLFTMLGIPIDEFDDTKDMAGQPKQQQNGKQ